MPESLIRGRYLLQDADPDVHLIEDGALFQRDGLVLEVGPYVELRRRHPSVEELGSPRHLVMPGLVNAHHHGGLSSWLLGCADGPLELWLAEMWARRDVDPYLDTLWSAWRLMRAGVTTVMHNYVRWILPAGEALAADADRILRAHGEAGLRAAFSIGMRDRHRVVYGDETEFLASLPPGLAAALAARLGSASLSGRDYLALCEHLHGRYQGAEHSRVRLLLSPANVQWCSDRLLDDIKQCATKLGAGVHMHLDETRYQHEWALRALGATPTAHLHRLGVLGPEVSCAHAVWLTEDDLDLFAGTGATVCHNPSSNLRLRSGTANVRAMLRRRIPVALGVDSNALDDDHDMLRELRLAALLHGGMGHEGDGLTPAALLRMATAAGAAACRFADVGTLAVGKRADAVLIDLERLADPAPLDPDVPLPGLLLARATPGHVDAVVVDGDPVLRDGRPTRFDADALTRELRARLARPLGSAERERREIARALRPHIAAFYARSGALSPGATR
jgi:cytosine/adenosine deaminase-related metal-dependent hydrolase